MPQLSQTPKSPVIGLETIPSSPPVEDRSQPVNPGGPPHQETTDALPASSSTAGSIAPTSAPNATAEPVGASPGADDDLPPLPGDPGRAAPGISATDTPKAQPSPANVPVPTQPPADDVLPPLPAEVNRSTPAPAQSAPSPAETPMTPASGTTSPSTTLTEQPSQPNEAGTVQPSNEPLPVLPADIESAARLLDARTSRHCRYGSAGVPGRSFPGQLNQSDRCARTDQPRKWLNNRASTPSTAPDASVNPPYPTTNPNLESRTSRRRQPRRN